MKKTIFTLFIISFLLFNTDKSNAQCCGAEYLFATLVQSGISGGYGIQYYNPAGLNKYIDLYNQKHSSTLKTNMGKFGTSVGFKVGANLIQIQEDNFLIGLKADYHQMNEKKSATAELTSGVTAKREFDLTLRSIGLGLSTSIIVSKRLDIKILEAMITWNSAKLLNKYSDPTTSTEEKLESPESKIGYSFGAGLTFYPLPPYISIEATGGYSFFSIPEMNFESGQGLAQTPDGGAKMDNFIDGGGLFAFIQLNLAIPFN